MRSTTRTPGATTATAVGASATAARSVARVRVGVLEIDELTVCRLHVLEKG